MELNPNKKEAAMDNLKGKSIEVINFYKKWGIFPISGGEEEKVTIPAHTYTPGTPYALPENVKFSDLVPGDLKDKPYMKDVTDVASLFKKFDGAQTLIGQRPAGIPAEDASDEDWGKFHDAAGRPKEAKLYEFAPTKDSEGKEIKRNADVETKVKEIFHKAGISAKQGKAIQTGYEALLVQIQKDLKGADVQKDTDFDALASKTFGKDVEKTLAISKKLLEDNMPEGFGDHFKGISNEHLILMAGVLKNIQAKYISEDVISSADATTTVTSIAELRKEARDLMAKKEFQDAFHPDHVKTKAAVDEIYDKIRKLSKKA